MNRSSVCIAAALLCSAGLVLSAGAQSGTDAPPPPPNGQMQGPPPGGPGGGPGRGMMMDPEHRSKMMQHELGLSADQTVQVRAVLESERSKMEALRSGSTATEDRRSQMMAIRQDENTKLMAIFTPDQQAKYKDMQARMRERNQERRQDGGTPPPPPPPPPSQL